MRRPVSPGRIPDCPCSAKNQAAPSLCNADKHIKIKKDVCIVPQTLCEVGTGDKATKEQV